MSLEPGQGNRGRETRPRSVRPGVSWPETPLRMAWRRFRRHKLALAGLVVIAGLVLLALLAPWLAPYDPNQPDLRNHLASPDREHPLGTDRIGRDVLSRIIYGTRVSLGVGLGAVGMYIALGTVLGLVAGYSRGIVEAVIMRMSDIVLSFPVMIIILTIVAILGPSVWTIIFTVGILGWPEIARLVRGEVLSVRESEFVEAARSLGIGSMRIMFRHILPNVTAPIVVAATYGIARTIITEASLSFLGYGVEPPQSSWGNILLDAQSLSILRDQPWLWLAPGLMITLAVLGINFIGDGLRDALDPKQQL